MAKMRIMIVGQGAREHALAWACARDSAVAEVLVAPGNPGTAGEPGVRNLHIDSDPEALVSCAVREGVDLVVVGPEQPIAEGLGDQLRQAGVRCLAPSAGAARLEASKSFAKQFMDAHQIPTAAYAVFDNPEPALEWIAERGPVAIKADGLAGGKGVVLAQDLPQAEAAVRWLQQEKALGEAGATLVVEEFLHGREASFIALCDGKRALPLATSEDHKARDDGDKGPNTGGMGAISPSPILSDSLEKEVMDSIVQPTLDGMAAAGTPYRGFLYVGLMISPQGGAKVLEYNCRLGDPEAQVLLMRHGDGFARLCMAAADGDLTSADSQGAAASSVAVTVVMASEGYPGSCAQGLPITGLELLPEDIKVFHGGTALNGDGQLVNAGGRVLSVTAQGDSPDLARQRAYAAVADIHWPGAFWRTDIGARS